jgi:hypothetical protein
MKKIVGYIKRGIQNISPILIFIYLFFIAADIITTYLASPDLKFEFNRIVRYFHLNFTQIIILAAINATIVLTYLFSGRGYIDYYLKEKNSPDKSLVYKLTHNWRLLLSIILVAIFFSHLINSFYVTINNYLGHIYLNKPESTLKGIADSYAGFAIWFVPLYVRFTQLVTSTLGGLFTFYYFKVLESRTIGKSLDHEPFAGEENVAY